MFLVEAADVVGTTRDVRHRNYRTLRLLPAGDPSPVSLTDITLEAGIKDTYGYPDRTEIAYCISGAATAVDLDTGAVHLVGPGTRLICVFDPPLRGYETGILDQEA